MKRAKSAEQKQLAKVRAVLERIEQMADADQMPRAISSDLNPRAAEATSTSLPALAQLSPRPAQGSSSSRPVAVPLLNQPADHPSVPGDAAPRLSQRARRRKLLLPLAGCGLLVAGLGTLSLLWREGNGAFDRHNAGNKLADRRGEASGSANGVPSSSSTTPPTPAATLRDPSSGSALEAALKTAAVDMAAGRVQAARLALLNHNATSSAEVAWALARAYDPTVLGGLPNVDAASDPQEAARWYRQWHTLSVNQGLISENISVERIISAMPTVSDVPTRGFPSR
jgi:hypothetical protein